jgi:hypothetical protein
VVATVVPAAVVVVGVELIVDALYEVVVELVDAAEVEV